MSIEKKFQVSLDETRLLMLASQIFFGFQFNGIFQSGFDTVSPRARNLDAVALLLMSLTIALLIGPAARHRIAHRGNIDRSLFRATAIFAGAALLPFSISLAIDIYIVGSRVFGETAGTVLAAFFWVTALVFWYGLELIYREKALWDTAMTHESRKQTGLPARIDQMLTEARVALPGAQALLSFQLLAMLSESFDRLPKTSQVLHAAALGCVALTVIFLIAPAAFHRIAFNGADSERFYRIGSGLVTAALLPLAFGMAGDIYVAIAKLTANSGIGTIAAISILLLLLSLWYVHPLLLRRRSGKQET